MHCRDARILIAKRIRESVTVEQTDLLAAHLDACPSCRKQSAELSSLGSLVLARRSLGELPGVFRPSLEAALASRPRVSLGRPAIWAIGCTALVVVVVLSRPLRPEGVKSGVAIA